MALGGGAVPDDDAVPDDGAVTRDADGLAEHYATVHEDHWAYFEALHNRDVATAEAVAVCHVELLGPGFSNTWVRTLLARWISPELRSKTVVPGRFPVLAIDVLPENDAKGA